MILRLLAFIYTTSLFMLSTATYGQTVNPEKLHKEISLLNDKNQNEKSLLKLEAIINDPKATSYDRYQAYLQKSLTYKQLYNYTGALTNLENAAQEGRKTPQKEETEMRILIERIFIQYDLKNEKELLEAIKQVVPEQLTQLPKETLAFYICVLGNLELKKGNNAAAENHFDEGIKLLEQENPKHLPIMYKAKINLYTLLKNKAKAQESFDKGFHYANHYGIDIYKITMLESMIYFYVENEDYKNAYDVQKKVSEERRQYDAANRSGKLNLLEKELLQQRNAEEHNSQKKITILYICIISLLLGLIFALIRLNKANKQRRLSIEKELELLRFRLQQEPPLSTSHAEADSVARLNSTKLNPRQKKIVDLVREGKTNKEIAMDLFISENTVKYHLKAIYDLLEVNNRSALM